MAQTPEGKIKDQVKKVLKDRGTALDQFWCVQNGMGSPALDCIGCYCGYHFEIETKAPGKKPTPRQEQTIAKKLLAGCPVFVIDGQEGIDRLTEWLDLVAKSPVTLRVLLANME